MPVGSPRHKRLDNDWKRSWKNPSSLVRDYTFIAPLHDWYLLNYHSSFPIVAGCIKKYAIVPNHGHISVVDAVAKAVAEIALA